MKNAPWIIILVLILVIVLQRIWLPSHNNLSIPETVYDTIHDTVPYPVTQYVPEPVYIDTGSTKWKWHPVDTAAILKDYYSKHYYVDTLANDSLALIIVSDTVSQNRIVSRRKQLSFFHQTIRETTLINNPFPGKRKLFMGLTVGRKPQQFGIGPAVLYTSKRDQAYSFSYDILNHDWYFTMYWKIHFK